MFQHSIEIRVPTVDQYLRLRKSAGLSAKKPSLAEIGLKNTIYAVCITVGGNTVGMGRIIGDGGTALQIVDVAVDPRYQGRGMGSTIVGELCRYIEDQVDPSIFISLIADKGAIGLYQKFGFQVRGLEQPGMYYLRSQK